MFGVKHRWRVKKVEKTPRWHVTNQWNVIAWWRVTRRQKYDAMPDLHSTSKLFSNMAPILQRYPWLLTWQGLNYFFWEVNSRWSRNHCANTLNVMGNNIRMEVIHLIRHWFIIHLSMNCLKKMKLVTLFITFSKTCTNLMTMSLKLGHYRAILYIFYWIGISMAFCVCFCIMELLIIWDRC